MRSNLALEALKRGVLRRDGERVLRESVMRVDAMRGQLAQAMRASLEGVAVSVQDARGRHRACHPAAVLERRVDRVATLRQRLERGAKGVIDQRADTIVRLRGLVRALGPESAFQRGFSITLGADGKVITSAASLKPGDELRTKFGDGETLSTVKESK